MKNQLTVAINNRERLPLLQSTEILLAAILLCTLPGLAVFASNASMAQTSQQAENLSDLIQILLTNNPNIRAAQEDALAAKEQILVEKSWADPNVGFSITPNPTPTMEMQSGARNTVISQMVPLGGQKRLAGRIATTKFQMKETNRSSEILSQIADLKVAFEEFTYLEDAIQILSENREVLDQISGVAIARDAPPALLSEIQRIQTQFSQIEYDQALLLELQTAERIRINSLLSRPCGAHLVLESDLSTSPPPASLTDLITLANKNHPDIKMAKLGQKMAGQETAMAKKMLTPDLMIGFKQQRNSDWRRDSRGDMIMLDFSIPLWRQKNQGRIREASHKAAAENAKLDALQNKFSSDVAGYYVRVQNLWRTIRIYEDNLLPQAAHALEAAQAGNTRLSGVLPEALEAQAVWLNFKLAHRRSIADYRQALARLDFLIGQNPATQGGKQ